MAQRGFAANYLNAFRRLSEDDGSACARAIRAGQPVLIQPVLIQDVNADAEHAPYNAIATSAGYRAVQSTPLISSDGELIGVLSTHFARPHSPSRLDMAITQRYAQLVADLIARVAKYHA